MAAFARRSRTQNTNIWPGFVDALATLLMVIIFALMIFIVAQFYLTQLLSGRDDALVQLQQQISELGDLLSLERETNDDLRINLAQISDQLQTTSAENDLLNTKAKEFNAQRDHLEDRLAAAVSEQTILKHKVLEIEDNNNRLTDRIAELLSERDLLLTKLQTAQNAAHLTRAEKEELQLQLTNSQNLLSMEKKRTDITKQELADALKKLSVTTSKFNQSKSKYKSIQKELQQLSNEEKLSKSDLKQARVLLKALIVKLTAKKLTIDREKDINKGLRKSGREISEAAQHQSTLLNQQIFALRQQISTLNKALDASEAQNKAKNVKIVDLGSKLNRALASKVEELAQFRSEFFGSLRKVLKHRQDIRIVGDRFVFQSEVLFSSGISEIGHDGQTELRRFAEALKEIIPKIPVEINWILQIEGHTDQVPIYNDRFKSNWHLSTARAISVVEFLIQEGVPAKRLSATGYGEFQPIDRHQDEIGNRRNRRIEMKLTQK